MATIVKSYTVCVWDTIQHYVREYKLYKGIVPYSNKSFLFQRFSVASNQGKTWPLHTKVQLWSKVINQKKMFVKNGGKYCTAL